MTTALAQLLSDRVAAALPYLDRVTGLARLKTSTTPDGDGFTTTKLPIPVSFTAAECDANERYLVPDASSVGILFFEDGGSTANLPTTLGLRTASLNLLLWINRPRLDPQPTETQLVAQVERALGVGQRWASGDYQDVSVRARTLPAEASLFGRYSFADTNLTPLLLPPYLVLGLALTVEFRVNTRCLVVPVPTVLPAPVC